MPKKKNSIMPVGMLCRRTGYKIGSDKCKTCSHFNDILTEEVPISKDSFMTKIIGYVDCKISNNKEY